MKSLIFIIMALFESIAFAHDSAVDTLIPINIGPGGAKLEINGDAGLVLFNSLKKKCENSKAYFAIGNEILCMKLKEQPEAASCTTFLDVNSGKFMNLYAPKCD